MATTESILSNHLTCQRRRPGEGPVIVIEGMDNSGKSTLARVIADHMGLAIQESEGPPRSADEINERVDRYSSMRDTHLFVRHPCVSNPIYDCGRTENVGLIT